MSSSVYAIWFKMTWDTIIVTPCLSGRKKPKCERCGRKFNVGEKAVRHARRKTGNRYFCPSCEKKLWI
ncbi:MAG TPA: hypothetical protein ENN36_05070 [Candidatus Bathyarchaeota archaeon]|nr:hypothetical protein [Candidatus Bathyarchaeota archaeon]